jgi:glycosyltransferase involved in cell wall biosynthesis
MPEAMLAVDGPVSSQEQDRLSVLATELCVGHRLHMTRSSRTELAGRYRAADVVVFPSEWEEPFGIVPLEAMACGVPVVATGTGGSGEFLHDGVNCLLFRAGDVAGLAGAVTRLAEDPALRSKIVAGGTQTALEMNMDTYADRLEGVHRSAAARADRRVMGKPLPAPT